MLIFVSSCLPWPLLTALDIFVYMYFKTKCLFCCCYFCVWALIYIRIEYWSDYVGSPKLYRMFLQMDVKLLQSTLSISLHVYYAL